MKHLFHVYCAIFCPAAITLQLSSCTMASSEQSRERLAIYSNFCYHVEAGDLLGTRIILLQDYGADPHFIIFQQAEGDPTEPRIGRSEIRGGAIQFEVDLGQPQHHRFSGTITPQSITGQLQYSGAKPRKMRLLRQPNTIDPTPDCTDAWYVDNDD